MAVLPNETAIPLWVLSTLPNSRNRAGYGATIWLNGLLGVVLTLVSIPVMFSVKADTQWYFSWVLFLLAGLRSLYDAYRLYLGRRWLDQHQKWPIVENLKQAHADEGRPRAWAWCIIGVLCVLIVLAWQFIGR
jgi:hypothetical protein